ncbi:MAG: PD40 domain-containing protein [Acidobacteriaceae bacterium]|nr:PD40 domain-containing protein [Acidobacteriaceae bacterium]
MENRKVNNAEMTPQPLDRLFDLFLACREMDAESRSAWLREACEGDLSLQHGVERLIREDLSAEGFLSRPVGFLTCTSALTTIAEGQRFGRYTITGFLGRGGMGEVWKAHDEELDRAVALKFLNSGLPIDQLTREARMASVLNHPGIVTVHDVTVWDGTPILVMELVAGTPLSRLCQGDVPLAQLMDLAAQTAGALAAAHAVEIVHGDLKPENIMLRDDGYVKILDFGLAHRAAIEASAGAHGPVFGTLRYMSPEQARGESLTPASDIFSFGLVLFELATGRRAFADAAPLDAVRATLTQDPPAPASVNPRVPAALNSLILAMLAKNPAQRPSAAEVTKQLGGVPAETSHPHKGVGRRFWLATLVSSLVIVAAAGWFVLGRQDSPQFVNLRIQPLTSQTGWEASPALSPNGKSIAFTWAERVDTPPQIYVKQPNDSTPMKLTDSHSEGVIGPLVWSPDSKSIAFKRQYKGSGAIFVIPSSGGNERKILDSKSPHLSARIDWSPDGTELAFSDVLPESERLAIYLFNLRTGEQRKLTSPPPEDTGDWNPKFSPDGRTIAFKRVSGFWADDIYTVPVAGGEPRRVTWERRGIWGHAWTADGKSLILSWQRGATIFGLWRLPLTPQSHPERIVQGGVDAITPTTCREMTRLAWVNQIQDVNIYRVSAAGGELPVRFIASTLRDQHPAYSPDGQIAFVSDRSGSREIWLARADGTGQKRVTNFNGPDVGDLQWSPDGRRLAFYSRAQGHSDIFTLDCDGASMLCGIPQRATSGIKAEVPGWSADGRFLYFTSDRTGRWEVWKQATSSGQPIQVTQNGGYAARESRDGKWLYFSKNRSDSIWRIPVARSGGPAVSAEELVIGPPNHVQQKGWTLIPDGIVFTERAGKGQPSALRAYQFSSKRTRLIVPLMEGFVDGRDYSVSVSPDLKWVLYSQLDKSGSNIMVAENIK